MDKVVGDFSYEGVDAIPIEEDTREWKVYFDNNFWGHPKGERAGTEIRLDREFDWAGYHWVIPAVYACEKILTIYFGWICVVCLFASTGTWNCYYRICGSVLVFYNRDSKSRSTGCCSCCC